jgi:hypothetical protein
LNSAGFSEPHREHRFASEAPQFPQNFMPSGFSNPHFEQWCIGASRIRRAIHYKFTPIAAVTNQPQFTAMV